MPSRTCAKWKTTLRSDLQITRGIVKGKPVYTIYDPISFQAHRLTLSDYHAVACLSETKPLQEAFEECVHRGIIKSDEEQQFFQFVKNLDALGLLTISQQSPEALYKKFVTKQSAARKSKVFDFLFLTIPLSNPDRFLDRTYRYFSFLYSKPAFVGWLLAVGVGLFVLMNQWQAFLLPLNNILATKNLLFMAVAFVALKVWHELGHGYACKNFGGRIPEMGCKLIVGMPLAYVDASSAWGFPNRLHRVIVMLGGMYFESLVAIPALLVWAASPESFVGSCAYQLVFMAGLATLLFNANPLMKFDGYFILSDLVGVPNLRTKAIKELQHSLQRWILGLEVPVNAKPGERTFLLFFGLACVLYTAMITISISAVIAIRLQLLGLLLAAYKIGSMTIGLLRKLFRFLLYAPETEPVRPRANF